MQHNAARKRAHLLHANACCPQGDTTNELTDCTRSATPKISCGGVQRGLVSTLCCCQTQHEVNPAKELILELASDCISDF